MQTAVAGICPQVDMSTFMPDEIILVHSPEDTQDLAARFAAELGPGSVLALHGELGSGKTCFVQGLARALGVQSRVSSPTFVIVNEHAGRIPLFHVDLYRIQHAGDADSLALSEYMESDGITAVEWAERAAPLLPQRTIHLFFHFELQPETRRIIIRRPDRRPWNEKQGDGTNGQYGQDTTSG